MNSILRSALNRWVMAMVCSVMVSTWVWGDDTVHVVTVTGDFLSIVQSIGGDRVKGYALVNGSRNLHDIQPKPSMVNRLRTADMVVRLGMGQDTWMDSLIQVAKNRRLMPNQPGYLDASAYIHALEVPTKHIDGRQGDIHAQGNPHYWLNPLNGVLIARAIRDRLCAIDPQHEAVYTQNYTAFETMIQGKMKKWTQDLQPLADHSLVTFHGVWVYFFDAFGLTSRGQLEPYPGVPPTLKHLKTLTQTVKKQQAPVTVISANYYPRHIGESFARDVGGTYRFLSTNVGDNGIDSYGALFDYLVASLTRD